MTQQALLPRPSLLPHQTKVASVGLTDCQVQEVLEQRAINEKPDSHEGLVSGLHRYRSFAAGSDAKVLKQSVADVADVVERRSSAAARYVRRNLATSRSSSRLRDGGPMHTESHR